MPKVIDLFAGAGGFGLGFQMAGYDVVCSLEIDHWAASTLRENKPEAAKVIEDDITKYQSFDEIRQVSNRIQPDVIIGGPPCQGFSVAGPAHKKDPKDPRNTLFRDFARWVEYLEPTVFVMENVKGLLTRRNGDGEKVIDIIEKTFKELGYTFDIWTINAAKYGVPQLRERVFIVGNKLHVKLATPLETHSLAPHSNGQPLFPNIENLRHAISVDEAIADLPVISAWEGAEELLYDQEPESEYQRWARDSQKFVYNHVAMKHSARMIERFKTIQPGQSVLDAAEEYRAKKRNGNGVMSESAYNSNNRRLRPDSPSYTIPAQFYSSFIHPYQHRNITAREAARLQSFPDSYKFMGKRTVISRKLLERYERHDDNYLSQYNQIGNAVPPLLAKAIAEHIRPLICSDWQEDQPEPLPSNCRPL